MALRAAELHESAALLHDMPNPRWNERAGLRAGCVKLPIGNALEGANRRPAHEEE